MKKKKKIQTKKTTQREATNLFSYISSLTNGRWRDAAFVHVSLGILS